MSTNPWTSSVYDGKSQDLDLDLFSVKSQTPLPSEDEEEVQLQDTMQLTRVIQEYAANLKKMVNDTYHNP